MVPPSRLMALLGQVRAEQEHTHFLSVHLYLSLSNVSPHYRPVELCLCSPLVSEVAAAPGAPPSRDDHRLVQGESSREGRGGGALPHAAQQTHQGTGPAPCGPLRALGMHRLGTSGPIPMFRITIWPIAVWEYFTVSEKDQRYAVYKTCSSDTSRRKR